MATKSSNKVTPTDLNRDIPTVDDRELNRDIAVDSSVDRHDELATPGIDVKERDRNPDAITGAPGSHPVGTGIGAAAGGTAGTIGGIAAAAAIGATAGSAAAPLVGTAIGGAIGAVVGAVAGGYAGKGVAEAINPTVEEDYWRDEHRTRPYYDPSYSYDADYRPAYRAAVESYNVTPTRSYEESEAELRERWERERGDSRLDWPRASQAMRDVYERDRNPTTPPQPD